MSKSSSRTQLPLIRRTRLSTSSKCLTCDSGRSSGRFTLLTSTPQTISLGLNQSQGLNSVTALQEDIKKAVWTLETSEIIRAASKCGGVIVAEGCHFEYVFCPLCLVNKLLKLQIFIINIAVKVLTDAVYLYGFI